MAGPLYFDMVEESTLTGGTGTFSLAGASVGHRTWAATVGIGNTGYYSARGASFSEWEVGLGTVGAGTLARTTILSSSNGGAAVNFANRVASLRNVLPAAAIVALSTVDGGSL